MRRRDGTAILPGIATWTPEHESWTIASGPTSVEMAGKGWSSFQYELARGKERRWMVVSITRAALASEPRDPELRAAVDSMGRSIVAMVSWMDPPPREVRVNSSSTQPPLAHLRNPASWPVSSMSDIDPEKLAEIKRRWRSLVTRRPGHTGLTREEVTVAGDILDHGVPFTELTTSELALWHSAAAKILRAS